VAVSYTADENGYFPKVKFVKFAFLITKDFSSPRVTAFTQHLPGLWSISGSRAASGESKDLTVIRKIIH